MKRRGLDAGNKPKPLLYIPGRVLHFVKPVKGKSMRKKKKRERSRKKEKEREKDGGLGFIN